MFAAEAKALIKNVGLQETLISNSDLNDKMDLLTLVKVNEGSFWQFPKYQRILWTLPDLIGEEEFSPDVVEEVLVKDFITSVETSGSGKVEGGEATVGEAKVSAGTDCVDRLEQPVSIQKTEANIRKIRTVLSGRTIKQDNIKKLKMKKKDKLTFVYQKVYNTGPVKLTKKAQFDGSISASCQKMLDLLITGKRKQETSFTVPEKSTFAYGLIEVLLEDEKMDISFEPWKHKVGLLSDSIDSEMLQQVREGIEMKETLLKPLADLPESTRHDLLKKLQEVLEVQDGLAQLEDMLDQSGKGSDESPQSQVVSSFMDLIDVSKVSTAVRDAVHLLISAVDTLLEVMRCPLISCGPETLKVLVLMVDSLKKDREIRLPESLPVPLQEDGELRWVVELLCSSDETLADLKDIWDRPPEVVMEVLALTVLGLDLLHNTA